MSKSRPRLGTPAGTVRHLSIGCRRLSSGRILVCRLMRNLLVNATGTYSVLENPPFRGINRRPAEAFGQAGETLYVLHRGNFNAYRGRIPNDFMRDNFCGRWCSVCDGDRDSELLVFGKLPNPHFVDDLRKFVTEAVRVRELYKARSRLLSVVFGRFEHDMLRGCAHSCDQGMSPTFSSMTGICRPPTEIR